MISMEYGRLKRLEIFACNVVVRELGLIVTTVSSVKKANLLIASHVHMSIIQSTMKFSC